MAGEAIRGPPYSQKYRPSKIFLIEHIGRLSHEKLICQGLAEGTQL